jgi:hypothetical protein
MDFGSGRCVEATQFIRRMRGKSRAPLVEANDGFLYVVKWLHDPKSANSIRNGALRNSIYEQIGLPITPWAAIGFSAEFFNKNRQQWLGPTREKPAPGYHYGSRWAGCAEKTVFEILPTTWYQRIRNRNTFWGAYVADVWTLRLAPRQAVFVEDHVSGDVRVVFIDHGSGFTIARKSNPVDIETLLYPDRRVYDDSIFSEQLLLWISQIENTGEAAVKTASRRIPPEWKNASIDAFSEFLIHRISNLRNTLHSTSPPFPSYRYAPSRIIPSSSVPFDPGAIA